MTPTEIRTQLDFEAAVRAAVAAALARDARSLLWVDPDFVHWPLDDVGLLDTLSAWLHKPMRRLVMFGAHWDRLERAHPRFALWRTPWAHAIDAREPLELGPADLPTLLLDDGPIVLELWERDPPRGRAGRDPAAAAAARDRIDAPLQRSSPAWPVKPLGL